MYETNGLKFIEILKKDKEKFRKEIGGYQLLEEYFHGLSKETLHDLLSNEDKEIRALALWIVSELGSAAAEDFLGEAASQINDEDPAIYRWSSEIVAFWGTDKYMNDFMKIFVFIEHFNANIRKISMVRVSQLPDSRIKEAYAYSVNNKILSDSHEKGLLSLIHINTLTASDITAMLHSDDSVIRKYGVIAASKVYEKYPEIIKESVNSEDLDVQDYAKSEIRAKDKIAQLHNQRRNRKREHKIKQIDTYRDSRFSQKVLCQHGCFLVDDVPCEVEIISDSEAMIRGADPLAYKAVIDKFRFYAPHITRFYDEDRNIVIEFPPAQIFTVMLDEIQPSRFYVDEEKIAAVGSFIEKPDDIIIQVLPPYGERYILRDGHTRLYYAVMKGWKSVRAVVGASGGWVDDFATEAKKRNIYTPGDLMLVSHSEYEEKWNRFCDQFFEEIFGDEKDR